MRAIDPAIGMLINGEAKSNQLVVKKYPNESLAEGLQETNSIYATELAVSSDTPANSAN